jgi:hypothetical protein
MHVTEHHSKFPRWTVGDKMLQMLSFCNDTCDEQFTSNE